MIKLRKAEEKDINSLKELFKDVFNESEEALDLFFKRIYKLEICYVCYEGDELIAMVYIIPTTINSRKAGYLYAAATKDEYRGAGIMKGLIHYALSITAQEVCVTLPANDSLYDYYAKLGFKELTANTAEVSREELEKLSKPYEVSETVVGGYCGIRNRVLKNNFLFWNNDFIDYAFEYNRIYGAKIIKNNFGYVIAYDEEDCCYVSEFICDDKNAPYLITDLLSEFKNEKFRFHLSPNQKFIKSEKQRYAMMKSITGYNPESVYLGLGLE